MALYLAVLGFVIANFVLICPVLNSKTVASTNRATVTNSAVDLSSGAFIRLKNARTFRICTPNVNWR